MRNVRATLLLLSALVAVLPAGPARAEPAVDVDPATCVAVGDQGYSEDAYRGSFAAAGEVDCLELPSPAGATIEMLVPRNSSGVQDPDWTVVDADGTQVCSYGTCELTGPAPYRVLITGPGAGSYLFAVQRTDQELTGCEALPLDAIGATGGVLVGGHPDRFVSCYAIPADAHADTELFSIARVGTLLSVAGISVLDRDGTEICGGYLESTTAKLARCRLVDGQAYTAVVTHRTGSTPAYRLSRKDAGVATANCDTPESTVVGGAPVSGTVGAADDVRCVRITDSGSGNFWIGVRASSSGMQYAVLDGAGNEITGCYANEPCRVTGSDSYRIIIWSSFVSATVWPVAYRVDTWWLGERGVSNTICPTVGATISGTLTEESAGRCVQVPIRAYQTTVQVLIGNSAGGTAVPFVYLTNIASETNRAGRCPQILNGFECTLTGSFAGTTAIVMIAPRWELGSYPFTAEVSCTPAPCVKPAYAVTGIAPSAAPNSGPVTLTLSGASLAGTTGVVLSRNGGANPITAVIDSRSEESVTATVDVTDMPAGTWDVTATSASGTATASLVLTAAPLTSTRVPTLSGTVRVGSTVKLYNGTFDPSPTSYTYQWTANGAAIGGATGAAYTIPASMRGRQLAVTVTAKRANRLPTSHSSAKTTVGYGVAPKATTAPKVTGTAKAGKTVKVSAGVWSPKATSYRYEWRLNGKVITGATASSLKLKKAWIGKRLTVVVTAKRTGHTDGKATSKSVTIKR
ncbi:hypothetical protein [Actinoplanes sp. NPDC051851]|uniref:hypothetical protein n=1 Tax=Actinoplanes sp. NPDC051851 TaxID=3154753 RepID=UPI003420F3BD